jgi:hypothetical protein
MKYLAFASFALVLVALASPANAVETKCKGDARKEKPPIPNYPHHIRNVIWRNTRAMCLEELSRMTPPTTTSDAPSTQTPSPQSTTPAKELPTQPKP